MKLNIQNIDQPSFIINPPFSIHTENKNNIWMEEAKAEEAEINREMAFRQWHDLYSHLVNDGCMVSILPTPYDCNLQDLTYVANMGVVIGDTVIVSNFTSEPRIGEAEIGLNYFKMAGFKNVIQCPYKFEGEADLKHLRDDIWVGGYGLRTELKALEWFEKEFNIKVIKMKMSEPALYHFDCNFFPLTKTDVLFCSSIFYPDEVEELQKYCRIIEVPFDLAKYGALNSVRVHRFIYNNSDIGSLDPVKDKDIYQIELSKNKWLEDVLAEYALEAKFINLSEFMKSGALASCLVMHANRWSYNVDLI
jgi:N-dimethylarginine dimethylaminohydrolase